MESKERKKKSNTRMRLKEALFFLQKMETNFDKDPDFDFYLNAFISSSRSVKWIMNKEYSKKVGWDEWNRRFSQTVDETKFLKKTKDLRNISLKEEPLTTNKETILPLPKGINLDLDKEYRISIRKIPFPDEEIKNETKQEFDYSKQVTFIDQIKDVRIIEKWNEDSLVLCQKYYQWLEDLVQKCEDQFINVQE